MNKLTELLAGGDWTNLDKRCHMVEITDTPEELDMREMAEHLEELCTGLESKRQRLDEEAKRQRLAQAFHQEELRRLNALLENSEREKDTALSEKHDLQCQLAAFEPWSYSMSDDEATHVFECLYQDLRGWVEQHYNIDGIDSDFHGEDPSLETSPSNTTQSETKFGQLSVTESGERIKQLKKVISDCFEFKQKLESQGKFYYFWWSPSGLALREERMASITGTYPVGATVRRTLWPMFYRQLPDKWVILSKEVVVISSP
ncbi:hypothetical protein PENSTE_c016G08909 [Penicillium steckii]|uniref:Uncharacterized protein n=1 Tax=Penicillium steckii TaxID=303698 RepID=A0A1V6SYQ4_9EURO|nr:hypothetical protein PENSTE_c016G08909 [Penicillium steckii]